MRSAGSISTSQSAGDRRPQPMPDSARTAAHRQFRARSPITLYGEDGVDDTESSSLADRMSRAPSFSAADRSPSVVACA